VKLTHQAVSRLIRQCLAEGHTIELEGLGALRLAPDGHCEWIRDLRPRVFIAYSAEQRASAERLANALEQAGFDPWLDRRRLLPGQNWRRAIEQAIEVSDFFVACFSRHALSKRGGFQRELRLALDAAQCVPLDQTFLIPFRLDDCTVPQEFANHAQWVDAFPHFDAGVAALASVMSAKQCKLGKSPLDKAR
jgi:hypothetical protein